MYKKVNPDMNFCEREQEVLAFWKENQIFEKTVEQGKGKPEFTFYDGPPTANGKPHIGHILTRVIKDLIPRYKTMKGYNVLRKAGWDTHGLPVEIEVEKLLNLDGKEDIEKYGVEEFIKKCKESVWKYKAEWEKTSERVGFFMDMKDPYITYEDEYIESVWWSLKQIFDKGLIYKGHKIVPYCPRCGTALSSHEIAQGYKVVKEKSIFVKFKLKEKQNEYFLAWTTTPWTLPSNVALALNPNQKYSKIRHNSEYLILADALIGSHFEQGTYEVVDTKLGKEYEYVEYERLFDYELTTQKQNQKSHYVTLGSFVTLTDGTGIVHIAPAFGQDDAEIGKAYDLPFVQMVNDRGNFKSEATDIAGMFAKDADKVIIANLKSKGLLIKELMYEHSYPFCWRCDTALLYYARESWFIKMTAVRDKLVANNKKINWIPPTIGTGRMGNFLEDVQDWSLSRERYWGTPLPIWVCDKCQKLHCVASKKELIELSKKQDDIELHRPYVDAITFDCACGGVFKRTKEVIDCWYDSGAMPFAQWNYPYSGKEVFEKRYPADFISEAVDQTRGWFYTLLAISTLIFDEPSFKNCIVLGHINDKDGIKMSKHKGNVIDPWTVLDAQGADAVRWYFYSVSPPWIPSNFYPAGVSEYQRKFMGTLWNVYAFYVLYADIDKFDPTKYKLNDCQLTLLDEWILSNLNALIKYVDEALSEYKITECARKIQEFTDALSNWYLRRSRERFWGGGMTDDKKAAYMTLYTVLEKVTKLIAPFTPFMAEQIYGNITAGFDKSAPISVHLCDYPAYDKKFIKTALNDGMDYVLQIVELARTCRSKANIKNRQPINELFLKNTAKSAELSQQLIDLIKDEINVKKITYIEDDKSFITYSIKPQLRILGARFGSRIADVREFLSSSDAYDIVDALDKDGVYNAEIKGESVAFKAEELLIYPVNKEGYMAETAGTLTVALDTQLTEELILEGYERELVSKIQTMRKEADFNVTDRIIVGYKTESQEFAKILECGKINSDILAAGAKEGVFDDGFTKTWDINDMSIQISLKVK